MRALAGYALILLLAWALSESRARIRWRTVLAGIALQVALLLVLRLSPARAALAALARVTAALQRATDAGTGFVFGYLGGGPVPFAVTQPDDTLILAFKVLPLVLVISALAALLYRWRVIQAASGLAAWVLRRATGVSGPLALGAAAHVFVGNVEAPLLLRPYLAAMPRGDLFALMSCGMAGIAGTVMVIYGAILAPVLPGAFGQVLAAATVGTPAALAVAALMIPSPPGGADASLFIEDAPVSSLDALARGVRDGVPVLVGIATVLLVAVALVALADEALALLPGHPTLVGLAAWPYRPVAWLLGISWADSATAARLLATRSVLNEFVAYLDLARLPPGALSPHARLILTYALCGFANLGSVGIMVGGMAAMVPERRAEIASLGMRSMLSGTMATCMGGALAGLLS